jgi:hypothetical protein
LFLTENELRSLFLGSSKSTQRKLISDQQEALDLSAGRLLALKWHFTGIKLPFYHHKTAFFDSFCE